MDAEWLAYREAGKEAHFEILKARLAASEARAAQEAENTARAIKAFADLARRHNALVAERTRRPWWCRLWGFVIDHPPYL
jgi:hypothetical protein